MHGKLCKMNGYNGLRSTEKSKRLTIHFKFQDEFEKIRAFAEQEQQELKQAV